MFSHGNLGDDEEVNSSTTRICFFLIMRNSSARKDAFLGHHGFSGTASVKDMQILAY